MGTSRTWKSPTNRCLSAVTHNTTSIISSPSSLPLRHEHYAVVTVTTEEDVRAVVDRAQSGLAAQGLSLDVIRVEEGVARIEYSKDMSGHQCGQCDVNLQIGLRSLVDDLTEIEGLKEVDWERVS